MLVAEPGREHDAAVWVGGVDARGPQRSAQQFGVPERVLLEVGVAEVVVRGLGDGIEGAEAAVERVGLGEEAGLVGGRGGGGVRAAERRDAEGVAARAGLKLRVGRRRRGAA